MPLRANKEYLMLWLLGVPLVVIISLCLFHVI